MIMIGCFVLGLMFGAFLGVMTAALCMAAKDADRWAEEDRKDGE